MAVFITAMFGFRFSIHTRSATRDDARFSLHTKFKLPDEIFGSDNGGLVC